MLFFVGKILTGTAPVAEFLLITGGTGTVAACLAVIGRCTGIRVLTLMFTVHEITLLFPHYSPEKNCIQELGRKFRRIFIWIFMHVHVLSVLGNNSLRVPPTVRMLRREEQARWRIPAVRFPGNQRFRDIFSVPWRAYRSVPREPAPWCRN